MWLTIYPKIGHYYEIKENETEGTIKETHLAWLVGMSYSTVVTVQCALIFTIVLLALGSVPTLQVFARRLKPA